MSLRHPRLFERQAAHVHKIVEETSRYDNLFYEICNEPGGSAPGGEGNPMVDEVNEWQRALILLGTAEGQREAMGFPLSPVEGAPREEFPQHACTELG